MRVLSSYFFIPLTELDLANMSVSDMLNRRGVSFHINCEWQLSCSRFWESVVPNSNAIISKTESFFLISFFHFWNLLQVLNTVKKNMIFIATLFRKLQTVKDLVRPLSKKHRFRTPFISQHVKRSQTLPSGAWEHSSHIFLITLTEPDLGNISVIYMLNRRVVS